MSLPHRPSFPHRPRTEFAHEYHTIATPRALFLRVLWYVVLWSMFHTSHSRAVWFLFSSVLAFLYRHNFKPETINISPLVISAWGDLLLLLSLLLSLLLYHSHNADSNDSKAQE